MARIESSVQRKVAPSASISPWGSFRTPSFIPRIAPTLTHRTGKCINGTHANHGSRSQHIAGPLTDFQPMKLVPFAFPSNNFKHFLTLFSKFFASFPHGTCSLSVSRQYLALDGIYHPLKAALPSNPTLRKYIGSHALRVSYGILTLYDTLFQEIYTRGVADAHFSRLQFGVLGQDDADFRLELFPLHSPLLGESWLVSFPPLNYMLKFSG